MSKFPLYDSLIKNIPKKDLTSEEKDSIIEILNNLDQDGFNILYTIIHVFAINNKTKSIQDALSNGKVPFKGKKDINDDMTCNFKWNFNDFPIKLKHIISKFLHMHQANMIDEADRVLKREQYGQC